jgi:Uncharacterized protein conserved in bacteria
MPTDRQSRFGFLLLTLWLMIALPAGQPQAAPSKPESAKLAPALFPLQVNGRALHYAINFEPVMPGEEVVFTTADHLTGRLAVQVNGKNLVAEQGQFTWRAPQTAGTHKVEAHLRAESAHTGYQTVTLSLLVMVPAKLISNSYLNGYRIGQYPRPHKNLSSYNAPQGFIEVTAKNQDLRITPNFTLGQFLCKQAGKFPKYVVLQPALLNKLEEFLLEVNQRGIITPSFVVMSGYRTPYYNHAIKNVPNSYHVYGGAADIYIDVDGDGVMDDINGDGKSDRADAALLYEWADTFATRHNRPDLTGGVGEYASTPAHGPFIHVDVRGTPARWGHWPP